jgi:hypothetical protein
MKRAQTAFQEIASRHTAVADDRRLTPVSAQVEPDRDVYAERAQAVLRQINSHDYPAGMVPWLDIARPDLYKVLTSQIPDEISRLWNSHAPLEEFERVLDRLASTHQEDAASTVRRNRETR